MLVSLFHFGCREASFFSDCSLVVLKVIWGRDSQATSLCLPGRQMYAFKHNITAEFCEFC